MNEISDNEQKVKQNLQVLQNLINKSPLYHSKPKKWKDECNSQIKQVQYYIEILKDQIYKLSGSAASKHVGPLKSYQEQLRKLKKDFAQKSRGEQTSPQPYNHQENYQNKAIVQTIQKGNNAQTRIKQALQSMDKTVEQGIALAAQTNLRLNQQIQQLDRMQDKVKDTQSTLKRAQKTLQCDKCMLGLLVLIILALVAVVVLLIKKNAG